MAKKLLLEAIGAGSHFAFMPLFMLFSPITLDILDDETFFEVAKELSEIWKVKSAMSQLAIAYKFGIGTTPDEIKAECWLEKSVTDQGLTGFLVKEILRDEQGSKLKREDFFTLLLNLISLSK
ncbi:SEL1-like repeat protein [Gallaecimonas kandeliae]|uniref:SEL1-like repeat protein n=1 Tax=Gallaecimonas kandeliae TaxID=3029055 RepID=UPI002648995F|nr:SEL1-like repeat protein [Gallaecimonas kandeliae]WKE66664.1 SEL1-like repeat protein [Gallaecimonas kandeliae]